MATTLRELLARYPPERQLRVIRDVLRERVNDRSSWPSLTDDEIVEIALCIDDIANEVDHMQAARRSAAR